MPIYYFVNTSFSYWVIFFDSNLKNNYTFSFRVNFRVLYIFYINGLLRIKFYFRFRTNKKLLLYIINQLDQKIRSRNNKRGVITKSKKLWEALTNPL